MRLVVEVKLGDAAMQNVIEAKNAIETSMLKHHRFAPLEVGDSGSILDLNGNVVGKWEVVEDGA